MEFPEAMREEYGCGLYMYIMSNWKVDTYPTHGKALVQKKKIIDTCMSIQFACMFTIYYTGMCIIPIISFYVEEWDVPNKYLDYYIINIIIQDVYK